MILAKGKTDVEMQTRDDETKCYAPVLESIGDVLREIVEQNSSMCISSHYRHAHRRVFLKKYVVFSFVHYSVDLRWNSHEFSGRIVFSAIWREIFAMLAGRAVPSMGSSESVAEMAKKNDKNLHLYFSY